MSDLTGDALPNGPDATEVSWAYLKAHGVSFDWSRALGDRLESDFMAESGGFASLEALPFRQRAVVSDQIVGAAQAVARNLIEARLCDEDIASRLGGGEPLDVPTYASQERRARDDIAFVEFFRAIGSALDNLAAVSVGVLRLPRSIRRASFTTIWRLDDDTAARFRVWSDFRDLIVSRAEDPSGWLAWALEMRHALMHRPRLMTVALPRPTQMPSLLLPASVLRHVLRERARWDLHFRRRPWLPDMQHLADRESTELTDAVLGEPAIQTVRGLFETANAMVEAVAEFLLAAWQDGAVAEIPVPERNWELERPLDVVFDGFAPGPFANDLAAVVISPRDAQRIMLASRLQRGDEGI